MMEPFYPEIKLKNLSLKDFRGLPDINMEFDDDLTVIIGGNGAGKTSILDALAGLLNNMVYQTILHDTPYQEVFKAGDVRNGTNVTNGSIELSMSYKFMAKTELEKFYSAIDILNDNQINGYAASMRFDREEDTWTIVIDNQTIVPVDVDLKIAEDDFSLATYENGLWQINLDSKVVEADEYWSQEDYKQRNLTIGMDYNRYRKPVYQTLAQSRSKAELDNNSVFQDEIQAFFQKQQSQQPMPLFAYYGGRTTRMDYAAAGHEGLNIHDIYKNALIPERLSPKLFYNWFKRTHEAANETFRQRISELPISTSKKTHTEQIEALLKNFTQVVEERDEDGNLYPFWIADAQYLFQVKNAILGTLNDDEATYSNLRVEYTTSDPEIKIDKTRNDQTESLALSQLSAGELHILSIISDMAVKAVQLNPGIDRPLAEARGIVLIDEIDLHLHPKWQRHILPRLIALFPKVQFIVTTHSPFIVQSTLPRNCIRLDNGMVQRFEGEDVFDYEAIAIDFFSIDNFFDVETTKMLKQFRDMVFEITHGQRDKKDADFIKVIKNLAAKGESVKSVIAFELSQMENQLKEHGKNK